MSRTVRPILDRTVFAYGSGRSGTTLLAKLLDASPETLYRHEPDKLLKEAALPFLPEAPDYEALKPVAAEYLTALTRPASASVSGKRPRFPKAYRSPLGDWCQGALLPAYGAAERAGLALAVPDLVRSERFFYLIKSVSSVCRVPLFAAAAPQARFIHIVRHPGAVLASLLRGIEQQLMSRNVFIEEVAGMANAKDFDLPLDRLHELSFEEQATYAWMIQNDKSERELEDDHHYYLLSYEDLCLNTKERVREMCAFIGIEYVPQMEDF
ncbi:MAG: sulfotransferase, partial [Pseudomonadota bacterium]